MTATASSFDGVDHLANRTDQIKRCALRHGGRTYPVVFAQGVYPRCRSSAAALSHRSDRDSGCGFDSHPDLCLAPGHAVVALDAGVRLRFEPVPETGFVPFVARAVPATVSGVVGLGLGLGPAPDLGRSPLRVGGRRVRAPGSLLRGPLGLWVGRAARACRVARSLCGRDRS